MRIIGVIIIIGMVVGAVSTIDYKKFIDLPSFLLVVGGSLGYVLAKGKSSNFIKNFGDGSVYMGWIGLMIWIVIIGNHHANTENIWPAFSIAFLPSMLLFFICNFFFSFFLFFFSFFRRFFSSFLLFFFFTKLE